jgi:hypothetical protein
MLSAINPKIEAWRATRRVQPIDQWIKACVSVNSVDSVRAFPPRDFSRPHFTTGSAVFQEGHGVHGEFDRIHGVKHVLR